MMESKHQQQAINNSIQITSVTLSMEGQSMESGISTGTSPREVSISTGAHSTDELEWHHRFKVVKVYGEPYRRGRFLCYEYDLNDATKQNEPKINCNKTGGEESMQSTQGHPDDQKSESKKPSEEEISLKKEQKDEVHQETISVHQDHPSSGQEDSDQDTNVQQNEGEGQNEVAIDNKIEQAMDLVKSHLMFAVREEVDVLKERITELQEKINTLEAENMTLRQYILSTSDEATLNMILNKQLNINNNSNQNPS